MIKYYFHKLIPDLDQPMRKAINYALNHWDKLRLYTSEGSFKHWIKCRSNEEPLGIPEAFKLMPIFLPLKDESDTSRFTRP